MASKFTGHQRIVQTAVMARFGTFVADDLEQDLKGSVSRATICRTLDKLAQDGIVRRVVLNGMQVFVLTSSMGRKSNGD
jgi:Fe2+ or Zn2+ uptake regulation protein